MDIYMDVGFKKILLINCKPDAEKSLANFLLDNPQSYQLITSDADENAFAVLATEEVYLVVIHIDQQLDFSNTFLQRIIANYPQLEIILVLAPDLSQISNAISPHPHLHILKKPLAPDSVGRLIKKLSSHKYNQGFTGSLKIVQLDDLLQMCCLAGTTVMIQINNDLQQGAIFIKGGEIIHAQCEGICGEEALYRMMTWQNGDFETLDTVDTYPATTINANYQYLLLEAARRRDELSKDFEPEDNAPEIIEEIAAEPDKLRVLIVDDSMIMTKIMSTILLVAGDIEVAGIARNGKEALEMMEILQFDLILLDVNMPVMNGRITMKNIMIKSPCPIVIMSNVGSGSLDTIISLLDLGVVDFISKPIRGGDILQQQRKIVERIRRAATAKPSRFRRFRKSKTVKSPLHHSTKNHVGSAAEQLVIISSGCSGHVALYHLISGIPESAVPGFISLHSIPTTFLSDMAVHISGLCHRDVIPVADNTVLENGRFYIESQRRSLSLQASADAITIQTSHEKQNSEFEQNHFDLFLRSAADSFQDKLLVVLLSGAETGKLEGLHHVRAKGGSIFVQSRLSCVIPDFIPAMLQENLIDEELKPESLASRIITWADL
jgi:two-component system chemotaxis response regulator CheB